MYVNACVRRFTDKGLTHTDMTPRPYGDLKSFVGLCSDISTYALML